MENIALCAIVAHVTTLQVACSLTHRIAADRKLAGPKLGQAGSTSTRRSPAGAAPLGHHPPGQRYDSGLTTGGGASVRRYGTRLSARHGSSLDARSLDATPPSGALLALYQCPAARVLPAIRTSMPSDPGLSYRHSDTLDPRVLRPDTTRPGRAGPCWSNCTAQYGL